MRQKVSKILCIKVLVKSASCSHPISLKPLLQNLIKRLLVATMQLNQKEKKKNVFEEMESYARGVCLLYCTLKIQKK